MQSIGNVDEDEMYRVFNMGIGMTFIVSPDDIGAVTDALKDLTDVYEIGSVVNAENKVLLK
jgi:phosphoribosylformylglycinamidine cyclo-ligase